ncbi:MAG: oxygenase MpaB family protein, partial [Candidatus Rokuibacteriota bacterium]
MALPIRLPDVPAGAGTAAWTLQREIILLLAWGPAILLQVAHPLVARGVADHSAFRTERRGRARRLRRTVDAMQQLCFGSERQALAAAARINAIHDCVHGQLPETAGIFAAGTPYSAHDPALLTWVHATLLHMNLRVYELVVAPLPVEDRDRYCLEASAIERHLGIPEGRLPRSVSELQRYMDGMFASGQISVTDIARTLARAIVYPQVSPVAAPAISFMRLTTIGLLPPTIRADYGFPWSARREAMLRRSTAFVRTLLPLTPSILRHWPAAR